LSENKYSKIDEVVDFHEWLFAVDYHEWMQDLKVAEKIKAKP